MSPMLPVSPGELLDRICILEIRLAHLTDPEKVSQVHRELMSVRDAWNDFCPRPTAQVVIMWRDLHRVLSRGWELENLVRDLERRDIPTLVLPFGTAYVEFCREIHRNNDERSKLKRELNELLGSDMLEEKIHGVTP